MSRIVYNNAAENKDGAAIMFSLHFPEFSDGIWPLSSLFFAEKSESMHSIPSTMWMGQKLLQVNLRVEFNVKCCRLLTQWFCNGHTALTEAWPGAPPPTGKEDIMLVTSDSDYCSVSPDVMSGTCWRRESEENVECGKDSRTTPARTGAVFSHQNDGTCSFLQAEPRIWGHLRQSMERGKQGRFSKSRFIWDGKIEILILF